jgi:hypothetical protein
VRDVREGSRYVDCRTSRCIIIFVLIIYIYHLYDSYYIYLYADSAVLFVRISACQTQMIQPFCCIILCSKGLPDRSTLLSACKQRSLTTCCILRYILTRGFLLGMHQICCLRSGGVTLANMFVYLCSVSLPTWQQFCSNFFVQSLPIPNNPGACRSVDGKISHPLVSYRCRANIIVNIIIITKCM